MTDANYDNDKRRPNKRHKKGSFEKEKSDAFLKKAKLSQILLDQGITNSPFLDKYETDSSFPSSSDSENSSDEELEDNFWPQNLLADLHEVPDSEFLRFAPFVTEEELLHRRKDKIKRLMKHYKLQFHRLRSVLKKRHLKYLKSKQKLAEDINRPIDSDIRKRLKRKHRLMQHYLKSVNFPEETSGTSSSTSNIASNNASLKKRKYLLLESVKKLCSFQGCKASCMPLTSFCYAHILHDPKQKLFTNCCHASMQGVCNYPVLIGQNPRLCPAHLEIQMIAMQREAMLKNQKRKQLEEASKAAMQAHALLASSQNKKPVVGTQQGVIGVRSTGSTNNGVTTIPVTTTANGTPMPININGFPLSQLSVAPRLIPITQTGQTIVDNKGKETSTVTVSTVPASNLPPNASPNITRINFPNPTGAIYAYNVMFSAPNGTTTTTAVTGTTTSNGTTIPITIQQQPTPQQIKSPTIVTPTITQVKQNPPVQVTPTITNPSAANTNPPVKKS